MSQNKTTEIYEDLKPAIKKIDKPRFLSQELANKTDYSMAVIGRNLKKHPNIDYVETEPLIFKNPFYEGPEGKLIEEVSEADREAIQDIIDDLRHGEQLNKTELHLRIDKEYEDRINTIGDKIRIRNRIENHMEELRQIELEEIDGEIVYRYGL